MLNGNLLLLWKMNFSESSGITLCLQMVILLIICFIYPIRSRCLEFFSLCSCCLVHGKKTFLQQRSQESTLGLAAERISQEICDEEQCCPILGVVFTRCKFCIWLCNFSFLKYQIPFRLLDQNCDTWLSKGYTRTFLTKLMSMESTFLTLCKS